MIFDLVGSSEKSQDGAILPASHMLNIFNAVFAEFLVIGNLGQLEPEVTWEGFVSRVQNGGTNTLAPEAH